MLGDKLGGESGQMTGQRVLPGNRVETSFRATGTILGVKGTNIGTYTSSMRPDGTVYGEGQGIVMGEEGHMATWVGQGVGTLQPDGGVKYRGAVYYQTSSPKWLRLNHVAGVFEFDVDPQGKTQSQLTEWK